MAKITIELNTEDHVDRRVLACVSQALNDWEAPSGDRLGQAEDEPARPIEAVKQEWGRPIAITRDKEDEPTRPIEAAQPAETAKRTRRTRAEIEADKAAAPTAEPTPAPETVQPDASTTGTSGTGTSAPGVTLADVNNKLKECLGAHPAAKIQEVVRQATDSKYGSDTGMFNDAALSDAEKAKYLADILAGLEAL